MPRTPKNPDTYINRNGMITRTVTTTKVKVEFVKLKEKQFGEEIVTVRKPGKSAVVEARKKFNDSHKNDDIQIVNIEAIESKSELVGMTEDEFIERGTILKPASEVIEQLTIKESEEQ